MSEVTYPLTSGGKRQKKIEEWEKRIALLHQKYPRLEEISGLIARMSLELAFVEMGNGKMGMNREEILKAQEALAEEKKRIIRDNKLPENIYEVWWDCEKCHDTGFVKIGVKCACRLKEELAGLRQTSGLSPEQDRQTFGTFQLDWYEDKKRARAILEKCLAFAEKVSSAQETDNLFLYGPIGTGKTHLCSAIANYVIQAGVSVVYLKTSRLLDIIRECKFSQDKTGPDQSHKMRSIYQAGLLIIDDLGTENSTDFVCEQLFLLLDERINYRLPWIISTNLSPNEIGRLYEDRLSDRILGTSLFLEFAGESIRRQKKLLKKEY